MNLIHSIHKANEVGKKNLERTLKSCKAKLNARQANANGAHKEARKLSSE